MGASAGEFFGGSARKVRDPVWGNVATDRAVRALLETRAMGRLKKLGQLEFAAFAFPAARHARFEHAVGVYHLVRLALKRITDSGAYIEEREVRGALAAALLHDAGCHPFAGCLKGPPLPGVADPTALVRQEIESGEVADVLREEWDLEPHNVFRLVVRSRAPGEPSAPAHALPRNLTPTERLIRDLLFGALDACALDRLARDSRGARVSFGLPDAEAIIGSLKVLGHENRALLALDEERAGLLQSLVFGRYLMRYNVYDHPALRAPAVMLRRAVQDALLNAALDPRELAADDDAGALALLRASGTADGTSSVILAKRLAGRHPYRLALELDDRHPAYPVLLRLRDDATWRRRTEEAWSRYLTRYRKGTAGPFDLLLDLPRPQDEPTGLRLIRAHLRPGERNPVSWRDLFGLSGKDAARCRAPLDRARIFAAEDTLAAAVRRHAGELLAIAEEVG